MNYTNMEYLEGGYVEEVKKQILEEIEFYQKMYDDTMKIIKKLIEVKQYNYEIY